jgi:hypothetical protein
MALTPHLNDADNGGWWGGDYGERICQWTYDASTGELRVTIPGTSEGKMRVIKRGEPIDKKLLARIAIDIAGQIVGKPFDV